MASDEADNTHQQLQSNNADISEDEDDPIQPEYEPRRPINKGKLILLLTMVFVAILVRTF